MPGSSATAQAPKKVKKSSKESNEKPVAAVEPEPETVKPKTTPTAVSNLKKPRKRAADFLDDESEQVKPKKGRKSKETLTADGSNGVVEEPGTATAASTTSKKSKKKSMMEEAAQTQDQELEDEWAPAESDEEIDSAPALLAGFDSDNEDPAEDKDFDASRVGPIPQFKKTSKKLRQAKQKSNDGPGVVYIGRIPHGFYEAQMKEYFSQFGDIKRLRLSRNKKTGASKHFAFIEFASDEVAKIVAETMDNYLMFGHILKCKYAPEGSLHEDVWKGANKRYRRIPQHKLLREAAEKPKTQQQMEKKVEKEKKKRSTKQEKMKKMGYEYDVPDVNMPDAPEDKQAAIEDKVEGAIVPPANVPKDELAVKVEEETKSEKKSKKTKKTKAIDAPADVEMPQSEAAAKSKAKKVEEEVQKDPVVKAIKKKEKKEKKAAVEVHEPKPAAKETKVPKSILKKPKKA